MRFQRIVVDRFGRLEGLDTGEGSLPGMVAVRGSNEAGKTSLFHFLTALLYGFYPASRDRNPYTPWSGGEIEGRAVIRLEAGEEWTVHRRLLSSPWGELVRNGRTEKLRNREVPWAEHVSLDLFREVYALTLSDLAGLEGESWAAVQDRLLGSMGASDLLPAREVWQELESEADGLWRSDRRGKPRARELEERIRTLRGRLREARDRDRTLREKSRRLRTAREELQEARLERSRIRTELERIRTLLPIRRQLERIQELEEEAGPAESLEGLPRQPRTHLDELRSRLEKAEARKSDLDEEIERRRAEVRAPEPGDAVLLDAEDQVRVLTARAGRMEQAGTRKEMLEQTVRESERQLRSQARELFARDWPDLDPKAVARVPLGALRERIRDYRSAREERRSREAARRWAVPERSRSPTAAWSAAAVLTLGLALAIMGLGGGVTTAGLVGAAAALLGSILLFVELRGGGDERPAAGGLEEALQEARSAEEAARGQVEELLAPLPFHPSLLGDPSLEIPSGLQRMNELLQDRQERARRLREAEDELARGVALLEELRERLELELPPEPGPAIHLLDRSLHEARTRKREAEGARRELARLEKEAEEVAGDASGLREELEALEDRLRRMGGGDLERGIRAAGKRLRARETAEGILAELRRTHPRLEECQEKIREADRRGEAWTVDEDAVARAGAAEETLTARVEALEGRASALEKDLEHLGLERTADEIEGAIRTVREELDAVTRERDRRFVLARLLREADRRFRDAHQPDLIRRAGSHLEAITGGRYGRIQVEEVDGRETFFLQGSDYPGAVAVGEPISTGTREQVYLALRLAIVEHLDERAETLPIFVDEALVNWDRDRRDRALDLFQGLSRERQIFVFTCHDPLIRGLEDRGARVLELASPP